MPDADDPTQQQPPSEEELRARLEEQLRKLRVQDLLLESTVSLLNLTARRIAKEDERDLEQARVGIEAVRALVGLLEPEPAEQVRQALSEVQMLYAQQAGGGPERKPGDQEPPGGGGQEKAAAERAQPGDAPSRPSRLWTPPGT